MKKILLLAVVTFSFITMTSAQQTVEEIVNKESTTQEVKKCDANCEKECCAKKAACKEEGKECAADCTKPCCADKKAACKKEGKECTADCTKPCCADKKAEKHAECKSDKHAHGKEAKECPADCTKPCCANKDVKEKGVKVAFSCPMKCESDKTYEKEGSCPKCKMDLKPANN